jgi:hypothetical protein
VGASVRIGHTVGRGRRIGRGTHLRQQLDGLANDGLTLLVDQAHVERVGGRPERRRNGLHDLERRPLRHARAGIAGEEELFDL